MAQTSAPDSHSFRDAQDTHPLDRERLGRYLAKVGMTLDEAQIRQFATGLANINYRLSVDGRDVVLRRPPPGELPPGAHDMVREHRVLSHLSKVFAPAPDSLHLCEDKAVIGVPFQIMEYRPGLVIRGDDTSAFGGEVEQAEALGGMLIDAMAALHAVDAGAAGLGDLGRPEGFVSRAIAGWRKRALRLEPQAEMATLIGEISNWLERQTTIDRPPTLLHCDLKLDNCILDPGSFALRAIVDWDMGTRGDPLFDLATLTSYWTEPDDPPAMHEMAQMPTAAPGFQRRDEVVALYAARTGRDVSDFPVLRVLAMFKLATVFHQLYATYGQGPDAREDYSDLDRLARELYEFTHTMLREAA